MRRKKRTTRRRTSRRHRVGDPGKDMLMGAVGLVAGAAAARILTSSPKILPNISGTVKSAGAVALGFFFPKLIKGTLGSSIGSGMIAAGGLGLLQASNVLAGIDDSLSIPVEVSGLSVISGNEGPNVMAGYSMDNLSVVAGMDEEGTF